MVVKSEWVFVSLFSFFTINVVNRSLWERKSVFVKGKQFSKILSREILLGLLSKYFPIKFVELLERLV